jgi:acetyltransferase
MKGKRVGVLTNSGGPSTAISNACELGGCEVPPFSEALQAKIRPLIPPHAPSGNPVDLTFSLDIDALTVRIPEMVMESGEVDGVVLHGAMRSGFMKAIYPHIKELVNNAPLESVMGMWKADFSGIASIPYAHGVPMTVSSFFDFEDDFTVAYHDAEIPVYDSPEKAARAMVTLARYLDVTRRKPFAPSALPAVNPAAGRIIDNARKSGRRALDEHEAKELLRLYGIPVTDERLAENEEALSRAASELGFPLVVKACDPDILHKTGKGLIHLNLGSEGEAVRAFRSIREAAGRPVPVLAYRMVKGDREFMAGMTRHPGFGPCVLFGLGGIFTEALKDATFRVAPLSENEAEEMLADIRASGLLEGFRGMPAADRNSLASILRRLSEIAVLHPEIAEIDLNPVIISGSEPVAVDALVVCAP